MTMLGKHKVQLHAEYSRSARNNDVENGLKVRAWRAMQPL